MDEQKKLLLKRKFAEAEKATEDKKRFERIVEELVERAKQRRDIKILN